MTKSKPVPKTRPDPSRCRVLSIRPESLLNMLVHYTEDRGADRIPVDVELRAFEQNKILPQMFRLIVRSARWECPKNEDGSLVPLDFRFTGSKVMTLGQKGQKSTIDEAREGRRR